MGRKPKYPNSQEIITAFMESVSDSYRHPGSNDEIGDVSGRKKQELLTEEFGISRIKVRKMSGTFSCHGKQQKDFTGCGGIWKEEEIEKVVLEELIRRGKQAAELLRRLKRDDYDVSGAKKEIADLKRDLTSKYMAYVRKEISQEDYMAFQKEVREKTAGLEGRITVTRGSNEHLEEVEDALKPLADGSVAAEKNGLTQAMVQELVENVWVGDEIMVEFKADSMMRIAEDELVG